MTITTRTSFALRALGTLGALGLAGAACGGSAGGGGGDDDDDGPDPIPACEPAGAGGFTFEKIATWADDAKGAYSFIHDDMCGPALGGIVEHAVPALGAAGIRAGLAPIVEQCELNQKWGDVTDAEQRGHEIVSHSYTHVNITPENAGHEIGEAKSVFDTHVQHPISFIVFPYDYFTPQTVAVVQSSGHMGARAGIRDDNDGFMRPPINPAEPSNDFAVEFDVWPRSYSKYALFFPEDVLSVHAHHAIEKGGWAMREFHSVMPDGGDESQHGFGPIEVSAYQRHLKFLADAWKKGVLWTAPPSEVLRYRHARMACGASVAGDQITFDTSNPDCTKFATPISVIVTTGDDVPRIDGTQGGSTVLARKLGPKRFSITADPTKGPVSLTGCSNRGLEVEPDLPLPAKPSPAASVCAIETIRGAGSPGKMDDLERSPDLLQLLPNPSQGDGRTGTWSWYPQNVQVGIQTDGAGKVLRYAGTNVGGWTGVTLAFLGGNGAGSCYDATTYQGVRFKIRGTVSATDELNGKVVVSLVTAETQSRLYGGDLDGEGGHFNKVISVTPTWQTVSIAWADLNRPTWGATSSLTAVAKGKLQAIDWGISNTATSFELFIDDIELY